MISNFYVFLISLSLVVASILVYLINFKDFKSEKNNKKLLKNLLEGFDLELPDELKQLENTSTDPQEF